MKKYLFLILFTILFLVPQPSKADTFGYTTAGASTINQTVTNAAYGSVFTSPANISTVDSISIYADYSSGETANRFIVLHSNLNIISGGVAGKKTGTGAADWTTQSYATPPAVSASTDYILMHTVSFSTFVLYYDTGDTDQGHYDSTNKNNTPTNPTDATHNDNKHSIYATYTPAGGGDTCTCPTDGTDWYVNSSDNCYLSADCDLDDGGLYLLNTGGGAFNIIDGAELSVNKIESTSTDIRVEAGGKINFK